MKDAYGKPVKLGIFILTGLLLFTTAVYMIGQQQKLFSDTFRLNCIFNNVSGLQEGNNVRYSGIVIGIVESIELLSDTTVLVHMRLEDHVRDFIREDAYAAIGSDGLMGNRVINIIPGTPGLPSVQAEDTLNSIKPVETDEIIRSLKVSVDNAVGITKNLNEIFFKINRGQGTVGELLNSNEIANDLRRTLQRTRSLAASAEDVVRDVDTITDNAKDLTDDAKELTGKMNENMDALKENFLFRRYYKNKEKAEQKRLEEERKAQERYIKEEKRKLRKENRKNR